MVSYHLMFLGRSSVVAGIHDPGGVMGVKGVSGTF